MKDEAKHVRLTLPSGTPRSERRGFERLCNLLACTTLPPEAEVDHDQWIRAAGLGDLYQQPTLAAAAHTLIDLIDQGWTITFDKDGPLLLTPSVSADPENEKARVRRQEHLRRDEQLRRPSVRRFIAGMEQTHPHGDRLVSVFDLMRDGRELAQALQDNPDSDQIMKPYVQIVDGSFCALTGFRLHDIWRYFRHTWSNAYSTVPGRSMPILIRDAATEYHTVIGLAAISSPVVQIAERDRWIGWETDQFLDQVEENPTLKVARWLGQRIKGQLDGIYVADLLRDGVLQPTDLVAPSPTVIARLKADAERHRQKHHRASVIREVRNIPRDAWIDRAETDLFRSKRSAALAEALDIQALLGEYLLLNPTVDGLRRALADRKARGQLRRVIRRARGERVGTVIADLTVCGAVAPYSALAAGKLVGALAVSPSVLTAYQEKYARPSEIASAMAGRAVVREARLSFIGTTSLYGSGSSQYNRLFWPADVIGGDGQTKLGFHKMGRSRSFGTSHFSDQTVEALVRLSEHRGSLVRVNSLFGEGVSPRLRKVRFGLAALGWPTNELLRHGRERILYGVPLTANLSDYSLGIDVDPQYMFDSNQHDADAQIALWWFKRWGRRRAAQETVRDGMRSHRLVRPVRHGARVPSPQFEETLSAEQLGGEVAHGR